MLEIRTRMAPSPTGNLHIGTAYATMWPFVFARANSGKFVLRIEDTDQERSTKEFEENIILGLGWLGYAWDEGPTSQMDRLEIYKSYCNDLLLSRNAYYCFCTKEELDAQRKKQTEEKKAQVYSGKCRNFSDDEVTAKLAENMPFVIRHKIPEGRGIISFEDLIHGKISVDSKLIGDCVIMRQSKVPLYNFAVVVDDIEMKISHVIRGDDHISNTPKQVLLYEAFSKAQPEFAHYPMILNQDRSGKLSKRSGSTSVDEFRVDGYLSEAMFNYIVNLGWTHPDGKEIFDKKELIAKFDIKEMNKAAAAWNQDKLDWINGEYIRKMTDDELTVRLHEFLIDHPAKEKIGPVVPLIKERMKKLSDFIPLTDFLFAGVEYDEAQFQKFNIKDQKAVLEKMKEVLSKLPKPWEAEAFEEKLRELGDGLQIKRGDFFQLLRVAVSGKLVTPPLFESIKILGEEETLSRINKAIAFVNNQVSNN